MKIKLCYMVSSLCNEGPVNVMYNIIKHIDFNIFSVSIITFIPEKQNSRLAEFSRLPLKIYSLTEECPISVFCMYKRLKKVISAIKPDILHSHCPRSLYLMGLMNKKYRRVYTIHNYPGYLQYILYGKVKGKIIIELNHFFTKRCVLPIACSESISIEYKKKKEWNIMAIPNGTSLPVWEKDEMEKIALRKELGLKQNVKYFIFIGRFSKEKNVDVIIEAFNAVSRKDVGLVMLGDGPMWEEMNTHKRGNIILSGFTTRVYDYLKATDYYISASEVEGMPNTILENMSVGNPMLLSDIPSHCEVLSNFGKQIVGLKINNHDSTDILKKINDIIEIDRVKVTAIVQNIFKEKYTAEVMSNLYQKAYMDLYNKK